MMVVSTGRPWEVRYTWSTGLNGVERFPTSERALRFWSELLKRASPPLSVTVTAENTDTHETLPAPLVAKNCGTCDGAGGWTDIKTDRWVTCSRCNGTGQE
ncbi:MULTISPECIES: hypothetical protein [Actinomadura]|uniref:Uncharacterized protein n=1 Tax=Actinomadura yumaensis TaxID=111807 RepID=A0ABW2CBX8_9ACTN|nr:hypothetical protein [Actinomadura sp. J1-007]MWK33830.1 hypothetical protein [Actinomadura sp. J1-007]